MVHKVLILKRGLILTLRFLQVSEDNDGLKSDALNSQVAKCCDKCLSEFFGVLKIPLVMLVILASHTLM